MSTFTLQEATIASVHRAFRSRELTATELVELYLRRIDEYDGAGIDLQSIVNVNAQAVAHAGMLDRRFRETGQLAGPLHGVPVLVKDQAETSDVKTTFGSVAFRDYQPTQDAVAVSRLREAGAIILAKTLMPDFAVSWFALSSAAGETKNPYDLARDPGGSSSGTAAAVAANLGLVGIGEDTAGSIRVPSSFCNLVGVRVTTGLISRTGFSPVAVPQDTPGPMTRSVRDAALLLDVLVGYDRADPFTAVAVGRGRYSEGLTEDAIVGSRVGVVRDGFGPSSDPDMAETSEVAERALREFAEAGAEIVDGVQIPDLRHYLTKTSALYVLRAKHDINEFIKDRRYAPVSSLEELYESKRYHPEVDFFETVAAGPAHPEHDPTYFEVIVARYAFQRALLNVMAEQQLDAIAYPDVQFPAPRKSDVHGGRWRGKALTFPTNTLIAAHADLPAVSVPAGFTPGGLPVGLELVGRPYAEPQLLRLAYAFEAIGQHRSPPNLAPPLPHEP